MKIFNKAKNPNHDDSKLVDESQFPTAQETFAKNSTTEVGEKPNNKIIEEDKPMTEKSKKTVQEPEKDEQPVEATEKKVKAKVTTTKKEDEKLSFWKHPIKYVKTNRKKILKGAAIFGGGAVAGAGATIGAAVISNKVRERRAANQVPVNPEENYPVD